MASENGGEIIVLPMTTINSIASTLQMIF